MSFTWSSSAGSRPGDRGELDGAPGLMGFALGMDGGATLSMGAVGTRGGMLVGEDLSK